MLDLGVWTPPAQVVMWEKDALGAYLPTDLGTPHGFWYSETATFDEGGHVLNELGQIVGGAVSQGSWDLHAYLWAKPGLSPPVDLNPSTAAMFNKAYGVSNAGVVVGATSGPSPSGFFQKAVLWQKDDTGGYSQLALPMPVGGQRAVAWDLNDTGQVVGMVDGRAVIWERAEPLGYEAAYLEVPPGPGFGRALAISNSGDVVGFAVVGEPGAYQAHAMLWQRDTSGHLVPADLGGLPGFTSSGAYGINDRGQIVGVSDHPDPDTGTKVTHAVLWETADVTPPVIRNARVDPSVLWPPNHTLVSVTVSYDADDDSGSVSCSLGPVTCSEPFTAADWRILDEHQVELRSERLGAAQGRVYSVAITCTDPSGNVARQAAIVTVPHDQRRQTE